MAVHADREHYLPIRKRDLVNLLCQDQSLSTGNRLTADDQAAFRRFCDILAAYFHYQYHSRLEELADSYAPFDPDRETRLLTELTAEQRAKQLDVLFGRFDELLQRGNFQRLTREQILAATQEVSAWGINLDVDFDVFERVEVYVRGEQPSTRPLRVWFKPWVVEHVPVRLYRRLVLILKQRAHKRLGKTADTRSVFLKIFKDIPKVDLEMLLPGGRLKMPGLVKGKLGASVASAVAFAGWKIAHDFGSILNTAAVASKPALLYGPLSIVLGYGYKQYAGYQQTRQTYTARLTESLYYQNLDSNAGVLYRLLDEAEEQDCREAFLAYFHLWRNAPPGGWTADQLDDFIEIDLERKLNLKFDFEVEDALAKLEKVDIVRQQGGKYVALPISEAMARVDEIWDNIFPYNSSKS